uniref:Uncharacterized protein n=1 Tax=Rhipicephalus zambeziensis TaxID=60191 RepID=A0A224YAI7_9ACAR
MAIGLLIQFMAAAISHILCVVVLIPYQTSSCAVLTGNLLSLCQPKLIPTLYTISLCLNIVEQEMFLTLLSFDPHSCAASHLGKGQVRTIRSTPFINPVFITFAQVETSGHVSCCSVPQELYCL